MDAIAVRYRVLSELGDVRVGRCGWNFSDCLLDPPVQRSFREPDGSSSNYWVVFKESDSGYEIVFDESEGQFGLATSGVVVGWYGDLMTTIDGM